MQLVSLADEHPHALNADLLRIGCRLRDLDDPEADLRISDLLDFVEHATPEYAVFRVLNPDWEWSLTNHLLASLFDFHQQKAWSEGGRKGPKPKPVPRPGVSERVEKKYTVRKASTRSEIDEWLRTRRSD